MIRKIKTCPDCRQPMVHGCLCTNGGCPNFAEGEDWRAWEAIEEARALRADELRDRRKDEQASKV